MLQVALGGYILISDGTTYVNDPVFYEPGFNLMSPLELSVSKSDSIFILVRKRTDGTVSDYDELDSSDVLVAVSDATNNELLSTNISNSSYNQWNDNPSSNTPVVLQINNQLGVGSSVLRARIIDCEVKDTTDNSFIKFRIIVEEDPEDLHFNYISVHTQYPSERNTFSAAGRKAYVTLKSDSDSYIIVSPYAWLTETTKELSDFSYPEDSFYYKREETYNEEDFSFALQSYSHSWVADSVSVVNVPGYKKVALVLIDNSIFNRIKGIQRSASLVVSVVGELSGIEDTFTVNLYT